MTDNGNDFTGLNYDLLVEDTLRLVVRSALKITEQSGLIGETHFYISFQTGYPGVEMDDALRAQHPETITIVIQHQFADLVVEDDRFSITLFFGGKPSMMTIPYDAMTQFKDPSVGFELYFNNKLSEADDGPMTTRPRLPRPMDRWTACLRRRRKSSHSTAFASRLPDFTPLRPADAHP